MNIEIEIFAEKYPSGFGVLEAVFRVPYEISYEAKEKLLVKKVKDYFESTLKLFEESKKDFIPLFVLKNIYDDEWHEKSSEEIFHARNADDLIEFCPTKFVTPKLKIL